MFKVVCNCIRGNWFLLHYEMSNCIVCSIITFFGRSIFLFSTFLVIFFIALNWIFISIFVCNSFFTSCFYLFCTFLMPQVLKPLGDNLMEENIRQSVTNSIKAGLTDQVSHHARLKTDWPFISWTPLSLSFMLAVQWELRYQ